VGNSSNVFKVFLIENICQTTSSLNKDEKEGIFLVFAKRDENKLNLRLDLYFSIFERER